MEDDTAMPCHMTTKTMVRIILVTLKLYHTSTVCGTVREISRKKAPVGCLLCLLGNEVILARSPLRREAAAVQLSEILQEGKQFRGDLLHSALHIAFDI